MASRLSLSHGEGATSQPLGIGTTWRRRSGASTPSAVMRCPNRTRHAAQPFSKVKRPPRNHCVISALGDDDVVGLNLNAKSTGVLAVGNSSNKATFLGSSRTFSNIEAFRVDYNIGNLSSAGAAGAYEEIALTVTGATTNAAYVFSPSVAWSTSMSVGPVYCSTAGTVRLGVQNVGPAANDPSTMHGTLLMFDFV
jgi:hypothetical protein